MLEIRIDNKLTYGQSKDKIGYIECLLKVAGVAAGKSNEPAITFGWNGDSTLTQRFLIMTDSQTYRMDKKRQLFLTFLFLIIYLFSILNIYEPYYISPTISEDTFRLTQDNSYIVININGGYDFYYEGQYKVTLDTINDFSHLKVYNNIWEVYNEKEIE